MAFPEGWPPRATSTSRSFRFFQIGTSAAAFSDNAWMFSSASSANVATPFVPIGSSEPVHFGPVLGGGRNPKDATEVEVPVAQFIPRFHRVYNDATGPNQSIEVSYDGTNVHDEVLPGEMHEYEDRYEGGISIRTKPTHGNAAFRIVAW